MISGDNVFDITNIIGKINVVNKANIGFFTSWASLVFAKLG